jgi:hypothetical protein
MATRTIKDAFVVDIPTAGSDNAVAFGDANLKMRTNSIWVTGIGGDGRNVVTNHNTGNVYIRKPSGTVVMLTVTPATERRLSYETNDEFITGADLEVYADTAGDSLHVSYSVSQHYDGT